MKVLALCGLLALTAVLVVAGAYQIQTSAAQTAGLSSSVSSNVKLTVIVNKPHDEFANLVMVAAGYSPSCWAFCPGITYTLDPTVVITNNGHDFEQCKIFGSAGSITCTAADLAQYLSVSVSAGYTPVASDTACHATVQTSDGFSIAAGTVTAGTAGTTVTTTISKTWTDATAGVSNIDLACLQTEASGGTNIVLYAEGQIASTSLNVGDSLTTTWSIART